MHPSSPPSAAREVSTLQPYKKLLHHVKRALFEQKDAVNDV
jgi:hypothetical protein